MGVNIIGFVWPTKPSKRLQKEMFAPNLKKIGKNLRITECIIYKLHSDKRRTIDSINLN